MCVRMPCRCRRPKASSRPLTEYRSCGTKKALDCAKGAAGAAPAFVARGSVTEWPTPLQAQCANRVEPGPAGRIRPRYSPPPHCHTPWKPAQLLASWTRCGRSSAIQHRHHRVCRTHIGRTDRCRVGYHRMVALPVHRGRGAQLQVVKPLLPKVEPIRLPQPMRAFAHQARTLAC